MLLYGAIRVEIQFLYNNHGRVGRHMKVLGQINYILEGFFITDILSLANLGITVLGLLGSFMYSNAIYSTFF